MSTEPASDATPSAAPVLPQQPHAAQPHAHPQQHEMPLAIVHGQPVLQIPQDLYIPPDALEVILEAFEGPLDLLLYLIRRQNLDILDIPVAEITRQYVEYIEVMREMRFELAAEYLVMAAILAEIKSRMLLPRPPSEEGLEDDPRADLVRRLQDYERFKQAAEDLDALPRMDRDTSMASAFVPDRASVKLPPPVQLKEMLLALHDVLKRAELFSGHAIKRDALSVRQRMSDVLARLGDGSFHRFESLFDPREGKLGVVVTFLSILELAKEHLLDIVQEAPLAPIYLKSLATRDGGKPTLRSEFDDDMADNDEADDRESDDRMAGAGDGVESAAESGIEELIEEPVVVTADTEAANDDPADASPQPADDLMAADASAADSITDSITDSIADPATDPTEDSAGAPAEGAAQDRDPA